MDNRGQQVDRKGQILDFSQGLPVVDVTMLDLHHQGESLRLSVTVVGMIESDLGMVARKEIDETGADREFANPVAKIGRDRQQQNAYWCAVLEYFVADQSLIPFADAQGRQSS